MKARFLLALASAAALAACNSDRGSEGDDSRADSNRTENSSITANVSANAAATAAPPPGGDIEQQIAEAARRGQAQVPISMGNGVTITAVEARGAELVTTMELALDLNQAAADQIGSQLAAQQCGDPAQSAIIRRGGRLTFRMKDSGGEEFMIRSTTC